RSSAMPSSTFRSMPSRDAIVAIANVANSRIQAFGPAAAKIVMPMSAPTIVPDIDTVPARYPSQATTTLTAIAHGSADRSAACEARNAAGDIKLASHSTSAADAGTETLSSRRTGIVSTNAATTAAASGARTSNQSDGSGV